MTPNTEQQPADRAVTAGYSAPSGHAKYYFARTDSNLHGFIHHPPGLPILCKTLKNKAAHSVSSEAGNIGLCFEWEHYIKPGSLLQIEIPLRGEIQKFSGRGILVRSKDSGFEIGIWLDNKSDSARIRIVEQICHIEVYLKHKRHHEGPFVSPERVAQEWINRFASRFPSFG